MKYSVIVPIYKVEAFLSECIESILNQSYENFELILVDDGSPDLCPDICDKYAMQDDRIKVVHKENGGLVSARKAGVKIATGDYVCFVDGDDFVSSDMLEVYDNEIVMNHSDMICAGFSRYYEDGHVSVAGQNIKAGFYPKEILEKEIYSKMLSTEPFFSFYIIPSLCSKCIKKSILESAYSDMPDGITLGEDAAVTYPSVLESSSVSIIDYNGYMYRQNPDSMTHTYDKNLHSKIRSLILHLKKIEHAKKWDAKKQIGEYTLHLLLAAMNNELFFNVCDSDRKKRKNMKRYLKDPVFAEALKCVKSTNIKTKIFSFCFRFRFLLPIQLYYNIVKMRRTHE